MCGGSNNFNGSNTTNTTFRTMWSLIIYYMAFETELILNNGC